MGSEDKQLLSTVCTALVPIKYSGASLFRSPLLFPNDSPVSGSGGSSPEESDTEDEVNPLLLDPTQWKDQDHYVILGLGKLRYKASPEQLKKAYRQKVLTHHPDRMTPEQRKEGGDDYFKCIKIAYDILSNPKRRRAYDSVDPLFDEAIPSQSASTRENFYSSFASVFSENARWSVRQPVPPLGDDGSSLEDVETFYDFWYNFESWREFSYLDEEQKDKAECREERKWMEKQNKAMRQKRKKEEVTRIRSLVDNAYSCDPRVKRFKEAEKAEKLAKKKAKEEAVRQEALEREKAEKERLERERVEREAREAEQKAQAAQAKKEKEAQKKAIRKERKALKTTIKGYEYFTSDESLLVERMQDLDRLCEHLSQEQLQQANERLAGKSADEAQVIFEQEIRDLNQRQEEQRKASKAASKAQPAQATSSSSGASVSGNWSPEEIQLLVKAVNLFPAGTVKRWDTIATYVNTHSSESCKIKTAKHVIPQVKGMQKLEASDKEAQNKLAFSTFEQKQKAKGKAAAGAEAAPTERYDGPQPWTTEEQKKLEQGLRSHPASASDRWDKIAEAVGTKTKAECIARFKELVAKVKAKKTQTS